MVSKEKLRDWATAAYATAFVSLLLFMVLTLAGAFTPAKAQGQSWTGCYIGAHAGYSVADTSAELTSPLFPGANLTIDGFSADGFMGGGGIGCDYQMQSFVIGVFGDYSFQDAEFSAGLTLGPGFSGSVSQTIEDQWTVGGRLGLLMNESTLVYGLVGYTQASASDLAVSFNGAPLASFSVSDFSGWTLGGGFETRMRSNLYLTAEYRYTKFDSERIELLPGVANLDLEPEVHNVRLGIKYKFGSPEPLSATSLK